MRRKQIIVLYKFQMPLILVNLLTLFICATAFLFQNRLAFKVMREMGVRSHMSLDQPYFRFLQLEEKAFLKYLIITTLLASFISLITTAIYSHRVVGPLNRLLQYFSSIKETGKIPENPLQVRRNDYFRELIPVIQEACEVLAKAAKDNSKT